MTIQYTISLSDAEDKALKSFVKLPQEWMDNFIHSRCKVAIEEIAKQEIDRKLAAGEPVSGTKEDIVLAANVPTAEEKELAFLAQMSELSEDIPE